MKVQNSCRGSRQKAGEKMGEVIVSMKDIVKTFPGVKALDHVKFELRSGEVMALLGENGAGKSTTIKSMLRLVKPDCGEVKMFGMDYAENEEECKKHLGIVLGEFDYYADKKLKTVTGVVRRFYPEWDEAAYRRCIARFELDETKRVKELSAGMKVKYALALALSHNARLLILDEPTAVLTPQEADRLFDILRNMRDDGCAIIIITHKLQEVLALSDRVAILRKGQYIDTVETAQANVQSLSEMMVGARVDLNIERPKPENIKPRLVIEGVNCKDKDDVKTLDDVDLTGAVR